ncbi:MAG TPA: response regulator [Myxococcaceae bacterium]
MRAFPDILIADDELLLRESLQDALEQVGYRVVLARHGLEALAMLDRLARPALVVLDLQMPVMDGIQFLEEFRKLPDHGDIGVLAMSATVNGEWMDHVPGVLRTLRKPFEASELISAADEFFSRPAPAASATAAVEQAAPVLGPETKAAGPKKD